MKKEQKIEKEKYIFSSSLMILNKKKYNFPYTIDEKRDMFLEKKRPIPHNKRNLQPNLES